MSRTNDGTFRKPNGKSTRGSPQACLGSSISIKTSATPSSMQRKNQFHAVVGKTTDHAGMRSARSCTRRFFRHRRVKACSCSDTAASALLARLDKSQRKRWSEAVNAIDSTHSRWLAWNVINNLTDRTRQSYRPCPISANSIASQLVKNETFKRNDREFTRLVLKEVS